MAIFVHYAFLRIMKATKNDFRTESRKSVHGASPFIYKGLHRALKSVAKMCVTTFFSKDLVRVHFLCTFEPE